MNKYLANWTKAKAEAEKKSLEIIDYGWEQHVIIDHAGNFVYRYPRNKNALGKLADEVVILGGLQKFDWPTNIPKMLEFDGKRAKYKFITGGVLDKKAIGSLRDAQFVQIGEAVGEFFAKLHSCPSSVVRHKAWSRGGTLYEYYERHIKYAHNKNPWKSLALQTLSKLKEPRQSQFVPIHGDLHGLNIVIDPRTRKLNGVIDFSETEVGDRHQDFRKIFMTDTRLFQPAIDGYKKAGGPELSVELIKNWAYVNELANVCRYASQTENITYKRAIGNLKRWGLI